MLSVIPELINGNVIRNGSIRVGPAWAMAAVLLVGAVETPVVKTKANAQFALTDFSCLYLKKKVVSSIYQNPS